MENRDIRKTGMIVALLAALTMLPFLGATEFYTKGEPREAIVAVTMLKDNNWILPMNNGGDLAYKPPMLHWCIALLYKVTGVMNEYLSRLPSALSYIALIIATFFFFARHSNREKGLYTALLALTAFELHRAGNVCRVDMMLTTFVVAAIYLYYNWFAKGCKGWPLWAVVCMSAATLTKGPVGIILPTMVIGVYLLLYRLRFVPILKVAICTLLALILPALWYWAAYQSGGDTFLQLVMEENFGRFTGQMTYSSHEKPLWYNFLTLAWGWLPWTAALLVSLFFLPKGTLSWQRTKAFIAKRQLPEPSVTSYSWLAFLLILLFYCIPTSKRSTYLLPCYPFMAFLLAKYLIYIIKELNLSVKKIRWTFIGVIGIYMLVDGLIVPLSVKKKYDRPLANYIQATFPNEEIYSYISDPFLRFFCTNYYLHDRILSFEKKGQTAEQRKNTKTPAAGILMIAEKEQEAFNKKYGNKYQLVPISHTVNKMTEQKSRIFFYKFRERSTK